MVIDVRVIARAGRSEIVGWRGDALVVRLGAAPVDGAANDALIRLLADVCDVPRRAVTIVSGERSRQKRVQVAGLDLHAARRCLSAVVQRSRLKAESRKLKAES